MDLRSRVGAGAGDPGWSWSSSADAGRPQEAAGASAASDASWTTEGHAPDASEHPPRANTADAAADERARFRRAYGPRTCRICFETVQPTFEEEEEGEEQDAAEAADVGHEAGDPGLAEAVDPAGLGAAAVAAVAAAAAGVRDRVAAAVGRSALWQQRLRPAAARMRAGRRVRVRYVSEDPADGRLISPCRCKGSHKNEHEGCLQAWRRAQPLAQRNFWQCPTCGFAYRMQRLRWGRLLTHGAARALLTLLVFALALFVLGFVADPLLDLWMDPGGVLLDAVLDADGWEVRGVREVVPDVLLAPAAPAASTWWEHFLKGFFSLGLVGVVKTFLAVSPFTWWNLRSAGLGRARRRNGGRARVESVGWVFVLVGALTFLGAAWKGINYVSGRVLERASDHIIDIGGDEGDDDAAGPDDAAGNEAHE